MNHEEVYKQFSNCCYDMYLHTVEWFPNGKNSVRVRHINGRDYVFTFNEQEDWCFETVDSFIRKMRGGPGMLC